MRKQRRSRAIMAEHYGQFEPISNSDRICGDVRVPLLRESGQGKSEKHDIEKETLQFNLLRLRKNRMRGSK